MHAEEGAPSPALEFLMPSSVGEALRDVAETMFRPPPSLQLVTSGNGKGSKRGGGKKWKGGSHEAPKVKGPPHSPKKGNTVRRDKSRSKEQGEDCGKECGSAEGLTEGDEMGSKGPGGQNSLRAQEIPGNYCACLCLQ